MGPLFECPVFGSSLYKITLQSCYLLALKLLMCKRLQKPINGLYRVERLVVINLSRLDKNGSINGLQNDKNDRIR